MPGQGSAIEAGLTAPERRRGGKRIASLPSALSSVFQKEGPLKAAHWPAERDTLAHTQSQDFDSWFTRT